DAEAADRASQAEAVMMMRPRPRRCGAGGRHDGAGRERQRAGGGDDLRTREFSEHLILHSVAPVAPTFAMHGRSRGAAMQLWNQWSLARVVPPRANSSPGGVVSRRSEAKIPDSVCNLATPGPGCCAPPGYDLIPARSPPPCRSPPRAPACRA